MNPGADRDRAPARLRASRPEPRSPAVPRPDPLAHPRRRMDRPVVPGAAPAERQHRPGVGLSAAVTAACRGARSRLAPPSGSPTLRDMLGGLGVTGGEPGRPAPAA
jgi:hypothetical protein